VVCSGLVPEPRTLTESAFAERPPPTPTQGATLGLVVVWCGAEPGRVGESLLLPPTPSPVLFGRGARDDDDPLPRVLLLRPRPGIVEPREPLNNERISRHQLSLVASGSELSFKRLGRTRLLVRGQEAEHGTLQPGDTLDIGSQLVFLCVRRPPLLPPLSSAASLPAFGEPDAAGMVGESPALWEVRRRIFFLAGRDGHVLVRGPSGSGKELVARAIHALGPGRALPLVARNAATIPEGLVDAELFGNAKNYPNPGMVERPGLIGEADGGTLFLDEFGELPLATQAHLLRVLDDGEYQRLGEAKARKARFRLVAATNRSEHTIKEDVLARFAFRVEIPPLDARKEDIPFLVVHLLRSALARDPAAVRRFFDPHDPKAPPRLSQDLMRALVSRAYPTNVRELNRLLWLAIESSQSPTLDLPPHSTEFSSLPPASSFPSTSTPPANASASTMTPASELPADLLAQREHVQRVLDEQNGVLERAWRPLGLSSRFALHRLIKKLGVEIRRSPTR
jgi:DNA-binding NtrC family response regulator